MFIARFFLGFGIGPKSATTPIFAAECSPPKLRGALVMQWQMWTAFGIMLGYVADLAFYSVPDGRVVGLNWRLMMGSAMLPAVVVCCIVYFTPEVRSSFWSNPPLPPPTPFPTYAHLIYIDSPVHPPGRLLSAPYSFSIISMCTKEGRGKGGIYKSASRRGKKHTADMTQMNRSRPDGTSPRTGTGMRMRPSGSCGTSGCRRRGTCSTWRRC